MKSAHLKPLLILLPIISIIFAAYYYLNFQKSLESESNRKEINRISELQERSFSDINGANVKLPSTAKVLIVHFWASWCGPCVEEFPQLVALANSSKGKIKVIAISGDSDRKEIDVFLKSFPEALTARDFHIIWDENKELVKEWSVQKLPESYIYNSQHKLAKRISGAVEWNTEDAYAYMKFLIDGEVK